MSSSLARRKERFLDNLKTSATLNSTLAKGANYTPPLKDKGNQPVFLAYKHFLESRIRCLAAEEDFHKAKLEQEPYFRLPPGPAEKRRKFLSLPRPQIFDQKYDTHPLDTKHEFRDKFVPESGQQDFRLRIQQTSVFKPEGYMLSSLPFQRPKDTYKKTPKGQPNQANFSKPDIFYSKNADLRFLNDTAFKCKDFDISEKLYPKTLFNEVTQAIYPKKFVPLASKREIAPPPKFLRGGIRNKRIRDENDLSDSLEDFELEMNHEVPETVRKDQETLPEDASEVKE